jgi:hypothetical protein
MLVLRKKAFHTQEGLFFHTQKGKFSIYFSNMMFLEFSHFAHSDLSTFTEDEENRRKDKRSVGPLCLQILSGMLKSASSYLFLNSLLHDKSPCWYLYAFQG